MTICLRNIASKPDGFCRIPNTANMCFKLANGASSVGSWTDSLHWPSGAQTTLPCSHMGGYVLVSNRIVLPPDGISFGQPKSEGMLGVAYMSTRLAATSAAEASAPVSAKGRNNAWTLVLDSANFAGPVAFTLPSHWMFDNGLPQYGLTVSCFHSFNSFVLLHMRSTRILDKMAFWPTCKRDLNGTRCSPSLQVISDLLPAAIAAQSSSLLCDDSFPASSCSSLTRSCSQRQPPRSGQPHPPRPSHGLPHGQVNTTQSHANV